MSSAVDGRLDLIQKIPFFEGMEFDHLKYLADRARPAIFEAGEKIIVQDEPATTFYVLASGKTELSFRGFGGTLAHYEGLAPKTRWHPPPQTVSRLGHPIGWASIVEPYRYRATATAVERTEMLSLDRELFEAYAKERPDFGLEFMRRILWLLGSRLRIARTHSVGSRYGDVPRTVRTLVEQNAAALSVTSPLHKIPHYLENQLTVEDAKRSLQTLQENGDEVERELAAQISDLLEEVWQEISFFKQLQSIYEVVAGASPTISPEELRRRSCKAFAELFKSSDHLVLGEENLPKEPGHIFIMNHLSNHPGNLLPNDFTLTLDTHFVSSMILLKKYGEAPIRVIRKSDPGEYGHQKYYDRLGYIYVYSGHVDPLDEDPHTSPEERRKLFLDTAQSQLRLGRNIVICPEGTSGATEKSPLPFKTGAFWLASGMHPEPLIVPIAVANFDKKLTRTKTVAVVHEPIRLSEHLGNEFDKQQLREFVNGDLQERFQVYVEEAVRLAL